MKSRKVVGILQDASTYLVEDTSRESAGVSLIPIHAFSQASAKERERETGFIEKFTPTFKRSRELRSGSLGKSTT